MGNAGDTSTVLTSGTVFNATKPNLIYVYMYLDRCV